jgi:outer membrane protein assembly factor BamB
MKKQNPRAARQAQRLRPYASSVEAGAPEARARVEPTDVPLSRSTLGHIGIAARVGALRELGELVLVQPYDPAGAIGVDLRTVRVFWHDRDAGELLPVWNSGINMAFQFVWSRVSRPGVYLPIGLPRDRLVREALLAVARERPYLEPSLREEGMDRLTAQLRTLLLEAPAEELDELRQVLVQLEMQSGAGPFDQGEIRLGRDGAPLPFPLPGDLTIDEFRKRIAGLRVSPRGLPEEQLFFPPERPELYDLPWRMLPGRPPRVPIPGDPVPGESLPIPWPPEPRPIPEERWLDIEWWLFEWLRRRRWLDYWKWVLCWFWRPDWWMHHRDAAHTGSASCSAIRRTNVGTLVERHRVALDGPIVSMPVIVAGKICVGSASRPGATGGSLYKIDLYTGAVDAQFSFSGAQGSRQGYPGVGSSPAVTGGRVYFSALTGKLYCLDGATLACLWVTDLRHTDLGHNQPVEHGTWANGWSSPLVVNNRVYVGFGEGESNAFGFIYCIDATNGNVVWLFCTNQFTVGADNQPNVIPPSSFSGVPPVPFVKAPADPPQRGASPWSAPAYDAGLNRIYICTGNAIPDDPLPDPRYASGIVSLDATTGQFRGFFQPPQASSYRPTADFDVDVPAGPMLFSRGGTRYVCFGSKNGSFFVLDADTMVPAAQRQLLPYDSAGNPFPAVDPPGGTGLRENKSGVFGTAAISTSLQRIYVGLGGYSGAIDNVTTPFIRALDWATLADAWPTTGVNPPKYSMAQPPVYSTPGETGLSSPAVVNDVVFVTTTKPALYALDAQTGLCLWAAPGIAATGGYAFGPAVYRSYVVNGISNSNLYIYSL